MDSESLIVLDFCPFISRKIAFFSRFRTPTYAFLIDNSWNWNTLIRTSTNRQCSDVCFESYTVLENKIQILYGVILVLRHNFLNIVFILFHGMCLSPRFWNSFLYVWLLSINYFFNFHIIMIFQHEVNDDRFCTFQKVLN